MNLILVLTVITVGVVTMGNNIKGMLDNYYKELEADRKVYGITIARSRIIRHIERVGYYYEV